MKRLFLAALICGCGAMLMLTGCGKPAVLHCNDQQTYNESYQKMTKGMSAQRKAQLDDAISSYTEKNCKRYFSMTGKNVEEAKRLALVELDELTADEIIAKASEQK